MRLAGALLAATLVLPALPARADDDAREWLERMSEALASRNYEGVFTHSTRRQSETMRIVHRVDDGESTERLVSLDGSGREIVRTEKEVHVYLPDRSVLQDALRCLAMMQHHGAPTRLLDFTKSPFVAAFFALEHATGDCAVYALDTPRLWSAAPRFDPRLTRDAIDPQVPGHFERWFAPGAYPLVWLGEPSEMDRRLVAQSGLLVMPGTLGQPLDELLGAYDDATPLIEKVVLDATLRAEGMHQLYRMNITQATLFPDLEGLARSIAYELEETWPIASRGA